MSERPIDPAFIIFLPTVRRAEGQADRQTDRSMFRYVWIQSKSNKTAPRQGYKRWRYGSMNGQTGRPTDEPSCGGFVALQHFYLLSTTNEADLVRVEKLKGLAPPPPTANFAQEHTWARFVAYCNTINLIEAIFEIPP